MPSPILTIALQNLSATSIPAGGTVQLTDVTTCAPNSPAPSIATLIDFYIGPTINQPSGATVIISKNVANLIIGQSYTRPDGTRALTIPTAVTPGSKFIIARLRQYQTVISSVPITVM